MAMAFDPNRWTIKTQEAFQAAVGLARERNNAEVTPDHLLAALVGQSEGVVLPILQRVGVAPLTVRNQVEEALSRLPRAYGGEAQMGRALREVMEAADAARTELGDEYLSTEHLLLAMADRLGTTRDALLSALREVRTFIDELHTIVGAGAAEGAMDAGNMIKPMLARGELRMIGATTLDEYRKRIEKDAALERRFQPVYVGQPTVEDTIAILRGLKERYEVHHRARSQHAALVAAAVLPDPYVTGRLL